MSKSETVTWLAVLEIHEMCLQQDVAPESMTVVASPVAERKLALAVLPDPPDAVLTSILGMKVYVTEKFPVGVQMYMAPDSVVQRWIKEGRI